LAIEYLDRDDAYAAAVEASVEQAPLALLNVDLLESALARPRNAAAYEEADIVRQAATLARSVRVRNGKPMVTDGPFIETKEAVGGFDLIECRSLEEAVEIAAGHPVARTGTIEVRPLWRT